MLFQKKLDPQTQKPFLEVGLIGSQLLRNPLLSKGTAFPLKEREEFELLGLLPPQIANLDLQCLRSYEAYKSKPSDLDKYIYLRDLQDSNETLFFALLTRFLPEMMPIVYTPTVGLGCQRFSHIYRHPRGLYLSYEYRHQLDEIFDHPRFNHVEVIVVSDGERILGLGDQGAGGMGIPIGKLALYTACGGIHPASTLPILLDTGTNNEELLEEPLYIGWQHPRIRGQEYDDFVEQFIQAVKRRFPKVLLQWEDFAQQNAYRLLNRYQNELCTFNDDIQSTAAAALGTLLSALNVTKTSLAQQKIVIFGAGSAGVGIAELILALLKKMGESEEDALNKLFLIDKEGLLIKNSPSLQAFQAKFAKPKGVGGVDPNLLSVIHSIKPSILIGVSGQYNAFNEAIVRAMAQYHPHPIIFPLSNPTSKSEATPGDLLKWTHGKAIISTGSPYQNVMRDGELRRIDQTNNCYIFPGLGLGLIASKSKRVTQEMFLIAAETLSQCAPTKNNPQANLLPEINKLHEVSFEIALNIAKEAWQAGLGQIPPPDNLEEWIKNYIWIPEYLPYRRAR